MNVRSQRVYSCLAAGAMLLGVFALYCPVELLRGGRLLAGTDYYALHMHRLRFARQALFNAQPHLPAWYPRELLGTPFWANVQNFPFCPTRLPLLLVDPLFAYAFGINLAALLAALFTYLYCRRIGLGRLPAAASGWTFAAAGFFASRVQAGHLPLLEAYPALPLLLWLIERYLQEPSGKCRFDSRVFSLGLASTCIVLAGHPQIPVYALGAALLYTLYRAQNRRFVTAGAMLLGVGAAGFALCPMFQLILRSTRLLPLDPPDNDIAFPYGRLATFLFPWKNGLPSPFDFSMPFTGYPHIAYFWDTVCYIGWVPVAAVAFLILQRLRRQNLPSAPWLFFVVIGISALVLALPFAQPIRSLIPGTILRSPARQIYVTTFALALALGVAMEHLLRSGFFRERLWAWAIVGLALAIHAEDLGRHDLHFVHPLPVTDFRVPPNESLRSQIGDGRIGVDFTIIGPLSHEIDDVGFFDSIILARPYRALLDLSDLPSRWNVQRLDGSQLNRRALAATGTRAIVTTALRADLILTNMAADGVRLCTVPNSAPRASFIPLTQASFLSENEIHQRLRDQQWDLQHSIALPLSGGHIPDSPAALDISETLVTYTRPSSDVIFAKVTAGQPGFLRVLESFDPGWSVTVDKAPARVLPADDFALAVWLPPGNHEVRFSYRTPGAMAGGAISLLSLGLLFGLAYTSRRV